MSDLVPSGPPRKGRGCFFYGCLTLAILALLFGLLAIVTTVWIKNKIYAYTEAAPAHLPQVEISDADFHALQDRVNAFGVAMHDGKPAEPLILTERDINAIIARAPEAKELVGKVYVSLKDDQVTGQVSFPLPDVVTGRYLNGNAMFKVSLENGVLTITVREIEVKGRALPEMFMKRLRTENLARGIAEDPEKAKELSKIESIQIVDGRVIIKARSKE